MGDIDKFIANTGEKAKYLFKKVTGFLSMGASFVFLCFSVLFTFVSFPTVGNIFAGLGLVLFIPAVLLFLIGFFLIRSLDTSKIFFRDYHQCKTIYKKINIYINQKNLKSEYKGVKGQLDSKMKEAEELVKKINEINKTFRSKDWDLKFINGKILEENRKSNSDNNMITKLQEQIGNIKTLKEREDKLSNEIANLKYNLNSIYTKMTVLDTDIKDKKDEIELEFQKILDHKLKVSQYEKELDGYSKESI
jgi:hypothetical protein